MNKDNNSLIVAIMFAAIIVSGSLIFFGLQFGNSASADLSDEKLAEMIEQGINDYAEKAQAEYEAAMEEANAPKEIQADKATLIDDDAMIGDPNAPLTIVEFSDYECPFCAAFYENAYPQIMEKYIDTGKVNLVYRDFPLSFHKQAYPAALAAECARAQGGDAVYFEMHNKIFEAQASGLNEDKYLSFVTELGLDESAFTECYQSEKFKDEIYADEADGRKYGIGGTPGFIVGNQMVSGAQPFEVFEEVIEAQLQ